MFDNMKQNLREFQDFIGYRFKDDQLLVEALTTPLVGHELGKPDYDFLENLGDAVLKIIFILKLYHQGIRDPGEITKIKASLESDKALKTIAKRMNLEKFIFYSEKQTIEGTRILADVFEAICGAIFFDSKYNFTIVEEKMINPFIEDFDTVLKNELPYNKNDLLEYLQDKFKTSISIELDYSKSGFEHDPIWIAMNPRITDKNSQKILIEISQNIKSSKFRNKKDAEKDIYAKIFKYLKTKKK